MIMLVIPYVCAEFHERSGKVIHRIQPRQLRSAIEIPDAVKQDPLFAMLVKDGSLRAPENQLDLKMLENDPDAKPADPAETTAKSTETDKPVSGRNTEKKAKAHVDT
jgi:hypothetical protein